MKRYIYVLRTAAGNHKIGVSNRPEERAAELGHTLIRYWFRPKADAMRVEGLAHRMLDAHALGGEIFAVTEDEAFDTVECAIISAEALCAVQDHTRTAYVFRGAGAPLWQQIQAAARHGVEYSRMWFDREIEQAPGFASACKDWRAGDEVLVWDKAALGSRVNRILERGARVVEVHAN